MFNSIPVTARMYVHHSQLVFSKHGAERKTQRSVSIPDGSWEVVEHSVSNTGLPTTVLRRQMWNGKATILVVGRRATGKLDVVTVWTEDQGLSSGLAAAVG